MTRILLSLALLAAQLASWNASPRYLCRGEDGTTCVDLGPATCDCCHHEAGCDDEHHALAEHAACDDHDHSLAQLSAFEPCGCTHVQLSEAQCAMLVRATAAPDAHDLAAPLALQVGGQSGGAARLADVTSAPHDLSTAAVERSCVVLRC